MANYTELIRLRVLDVYCVDLKLFGNVKSNILMVHKTLGQFHDNNNQTHGDLGLSRTQDLSYNKERRLKRKEDKFQSFVRSRLEKNLSLNRIDTPIDPIFEAGVTTMPPTNKVSVPFYSEQLYLDQ
jgi:hypothetical protein